MKQKITALVALLTMLLFAVACSIGGGSSASNFVAGNTNSAKTSTVQVTVGDAPSDSVLSFSVSIDSIVLTDAAGASVSVLPASTRVELAHLAGTSTPIASVDIPQGTYSKIAITVSDPQLTLIRPATGDTITTSLSLSVTRTIQLDPALQLGGTGVSLDLDLSLADSVSVDANGNVSFNPRFLVRHNLLTVAAVLLPRLEPIVGRVQTVSGSTFTASVRFGRATLTIDTNDQTQFVGVGGVGDLTPGMIVSAFARLSSDGHLLATKVVSMPPPAVLGLEGIVKSASGTPLTQFALIPRDGIGDRISGLLFPWLAGRTIDITVGGSTVYAIDSGGLDISALPFTATFDAGSLGAGQQVNVHAPSPTLAITTDSVSIALVASHVTLEPQPVAGQVSAYSGGETFTLVLPQDSAIARLTHSTTLPVFVQSKKTTLTGAASNGSVALTNGAGVIVRGLLFLDGGQYKLAATQILIVQ